MHVCVCARVCGGESSRISCPFDRGIKAVEMEHKDLGLTIFLAWSHGPTAGGQMSGVPVLSSRARVGTSDSPPSLCKGSQRTSLSTG